MFIKSNTALLLAFIATAATMDTADAMYGRRSCSGSNHNNNNNNMMDRYNHHPLSRRKNYKYNRSSPLNSLDLLGDIFTMPLFSSSTNSLMRQHQRNMDAQLRNPSSPRYEVEEEEDRFNIFMEVPGMKAHDLSVELQDDGTTLRVHGTRSHHSTARYSSSTLSSSSHSRFDQMFHLDKNVVDVANLSVALEDGILTIQLPKQKVETTKEEKETLQIPIQVKEEEKATPKSLGFSTTATKGLEVIEDENKDDTKEKITEAIEKKSEDDSLEISPEEDI